MSCQPEVMGRYNLVYNPTPRCYRNMYVYRGDMMHCIYRQTFLDRITSAQTAFYDDNKYNSIIEFHIENSLPSLNSTIVVFLQKKTNMLQNHKLEFGGIVIDYTL